MDKLLNMIPSIDIWPHFDPNLIGDIVEVDVDDVVDGDRAGA